MTAAPLDTITVRERNGNAPRPTIPTIPIRFHMYWAGSDQDGAVVGFYWAVVETLPLPVEGSPDVPPLPAPRTSQYRFTAKTDSIFTFNVSEFRHDRQHAFYIYAVDDKGRGDPTPARFVFNALDRFPPLPIFDVASVTGPIVRMAGHGITVAKDTTILIKDTSVIDRPVPRDTVMSGGRIDFRWHGQAQTADGIPVKYKYKLDDPAFTEVDSSVHSVSYNTGINGDVITPGLKVFTLKTIDAAGGANDSTRRFQVNFSPDSWFAGPDPNLVPVVTADPFDATNSGRNVGHRYRTISTGTEWKNLPTSGGSMLSCDSLYYWPAERKPRKTFWEIYGDGQGHSRLFLRSENDTIDMNSIVVLQAGGADIDSRYNINIKNNHLDPDTLFCNGEPARVLRPGPANGSPVGFRYQFANALDPNAVSISTPSPSALFPVFDAASPSEQPTINGYKEFNQSGRVYLIIRAVDGDAGSIDTGVDQRLSDAYSARLMTDEVDRGGGTPDQRNLRQQLMLTFYVNRAPYLDFDQAVFFPKPPANNNNVVASSADRVLHVNLPGIDPDPYDGSSQAGGRSATTVLRTQVTVTGLNAAGHDTSYTAPKEFTSAYTIDLPADASYIKSTRVYVNIQLCDCANCEQTPGAGRCVTYPPIPVDMPPPAADALGNVAPSRPTGTNSQVTSSRSLMP